jgi:hypothetical protein
MIESGLNSEVRLDVLERASQREARIEIGAPETIPVVFFLLDKLRRSLVKLTGETKRPLASDFPGNPWRE